MTEIGGLDRTTDGPQASMMDPFELLIRTLKSWKTALAILIIGVMLTILALHFLPRKYSVTMTVTAVSAAGGPKLGALSSLSNLAGISIPGENGGDFDLFLSQIASAAVAEQLVQNRPTVIRSIFWQEWNSSGSVWQSPPDKLKWLKQPIKFLLGMPDRPWQQPNSARVREFLQKDLKIQRNKKDAVAQIVIETDRPQMAVAVLNAVYMELDSMLRRRSNSRTHAYVEYLTKKIPNISLSQQRDALYVILSEQEKLLMVSSSTLPFAAESFGRPYISPEPISPRIPLVLGLGLVLSLISSVVLTLFVERRKRPLIS